MHINMPEIFATTWCCMCAAVEASQLQPDVSKHTPGRITIVALSCHVYGKLKSVQRNSMNLTETCCCMHAAVDASQFKPDVSQRTPGRITVVALSRLVYRKGIDLLVVIIPEMCHRHPQVDFVIGRPRFVT